VGIPISEKQGRNGWRPTFGRVIRSGLGIPRSEEGPASANFGALFISMIATAKLAVIKRRHGVRLVLRAPKR